jgi:hypothetical protein
LAGVPKPVLDRAQEVLAELEARHLQTKEQPPPGRKRRRDPLSQPSLFTELEATERTDLTEGKTAS